MRDATTAGTAIGREACARVLAALSLDIPPTMLGQPLAAAFGARAMPWRDVVAQVGRHGYRQEVRVRRVAGAGYLMQGSVGR